MGGISMGYLLLVLVRQHLINSDVLRGVSSVHHCKMSLETKLLLNPSLPGRSMIFFK